MSEKDISQKSGEETKITNNIKEYDDLDISQVILHGLEAEYTNVSKISKKTNELREKDIFDIIKFTIKIKANYDYSWEVYRKPSEVKKNFKDIRTELSQESSVSGQEAEIFKKMETMKEDNIQLNIQEINDYYKIFFKDVKIYNTLSFKEFFNISNVSFITLNSGSKPLEGYCDLKVEQQSSSFANKIKGLFSSSDQYKSIWLVVKNDYLFYLDKSNSETGNDIFFFRKDFSVSKEGKDMITLQNKSKSLTIKFKTAFEREMWFYEISGRAEKMLNILENNCFKSYTNEKKGNIAQWFSDGEDYFKDLLEKLMQAEETIFITGWWISPEVWLARPIQAKTYQDMELQKKNKKDTPPYSRLMDVLYHCANRGVKIYILVYAEYCLYSFLNSDHTQKAFENLHPNIQIERHLLNCNDFLWSYNEKLVIIDQNIGYVGGLDLCWGRWDTHKHPIFEAQNNQQEYYFPGIDYSNPRIRNFDKVENYLVENCKRDIFEVRMPWHDVHSRLIGPVVADMARHFVERWNFSTSSKSTYITKLKSNDSISKGKNELNDENFDSCDKGVKSRVQALRSVSKWSVGAESKENSILQAYYTLIDNAHHYIYIESQFFISRSFNEEEKEECNYSLSEEVENLIAYHIRKRIEKAYMSNEKFRVFVLIPLIPGVPEEPENSYNLKINLKYTYEGICRNHGLSIIEKLEKVMGDKWRNYIGFYSLRGHGLVNGEPKTEIINIGSKLMIVDDKTVILGSANINDRSMLGSRDSEFAVMINESTKLKSIMDGKDYNAANFAYILRVNLLAEHLGVDPQNSILADPLNDELLN